MSAIALPASPLAIPQQTQQQHRQHHQSSQQLHSRPSSHLKKSMSISQTYYLAHKARGKLSHEAARPDHNLRLLVGHANLLDSLMLDLAEAEREQESWFNQSVRGASKAQPQPHHDRHVQWVDQVYDDSDSESDGGSDSDLDSDFGDDDEHIDVDMIDAVASLQKLQQQRTYHHSHPHVSFQPMTTLDEVEEQYSDDEDLEGLALTRSPSHSAAASPPELVHHDSDDSSDDESAMPPSPPTASLLTFSEKEIDSDDDVESVHHDHTIHHHQKHAYYSQGFYLPGSPTRPVSAISVY